ncbi:MAG TPA: ECF-type sigma factor [Thermoanaerobaculia bacterium]|nr:ECF-type sigma factor [Thermoanaerobaculia bacterium]
MSGDVTRWLERWRDGDREALDRIVPLLYDELREVARRALRRERPNHTLSTTALVNEAYLRLLDQRRIAAQDRAGFLAVAACTMRRLLVDYARSRRRDKRGGGAEALPIEEAELFMTSGEAEEILALDLALDRLAAANPRGSQVIEHRYFAGLSLEESAEVLGVSAKTVQRDFLAAQAWLRKELHGA